MCKISYDERAMTYTKALIHFGQTNQCTVAIEELSECQKVKRLDDRLREGL